VLDNCHSSRRESHPSSRVYRRFVGFTSGIDIHYQPSSIVHDAHQAAAPGLTVGMRVIPQIIIRAADAQPVEIQDLLVSDTRFKVFVFTGKPEAQLPAVQAAADALEQALERVFPGVRAQAVDIIAVCIGSIREMDYNVVPPLLRSHWTKYVGRPEAFAPF
jgi:phenol 2-monooxygenase (NADPH)